MKIIEGRATRLPGGQASDPPAGRAGERRVAFATLGCKANWTDTEELIQRCRALGFDIVPFDGDADAYVINTCTVTSVADQQSRQLVRRARRKNPRAVVVACGCLGEVDRESLKDERRATRLPGGQASDERLVLDAVFGTKDRNGVIEYLRHLQSDFTISRSSDLTISQSRARAFLKIQDGCDRRCTYCIVPRARGESRSLAPDEVIKKCRELSRWHREIILTGIDIGQYGRDIPLPLTPSHKGRENFMSLLDKLATFDWMPRVRISSIDPTIVDDRFAKLLRTGKFCRHIHLSIQSGSDNVLKKMGRGYGAENIAAVVGRLADNIKDIAVTGDVIAGFPGEEDKDHADTMELFEKLPLAGLHVFPYSEREGTRAAEMRDKVRNALRTERAAELRALAAGKRKKFLAGLVGGMQDVIVTSKVADADGLVGAFSDNAVNVLMPAGVVEYGEIGRAKITHAENLRTKGIWESTRKRKTS